jgi:hypothetical protein
VFRHSLAIALAWAALSAPAAGQSPGLPPEDGIAKLLRSLEQGLQAGDPEQYVQLLAPIANQDEARVFAEGWYDPRITRAAVRERDRQPLAEIPEGDGYELYVDIFTEFGRQGRLGSWRLDVRRSASAGLEWQIAAQNETSAFEGLHQLELNRHRQLEATDLVIAAEDLVLRVPEATVFVSEIPSGTTALVVMGRGEMTFSPRPEAERGQVRILTGDEVLRTRADAVFVRLNPSQLGARVSGTLEERPVDARELQRALEIFDEEVSRSFSIDLRDLSPDLWSTVPLPDDFIAEIRTRGYDTLTYTRLAGDLEDIGLSDRRRGRTIALYASQQKLAERGRFYSEDERADFDILRYDVEARFEPDRLWIEGRTGLRLEVTKGPLGSFSLRLARELALRSVISPEYGRLLALRGFNQDTIIVQLPEAAPRGDVFDVVVSYAGRLEPQPVSREVLRLAGDTPGPGGQDERRDPRFDNALLVPLERSWLYSVNSNWYAQSSVTDFAPARMQLAVPDGYASIASGAVAGPSEVGPLPDGGRNLTWRRTTFVAGQPIRYLSWLVSRFSHEADATAAVDPAAAAAPSMFGFPSVDVGVEANPRQSGRGREIGERAAGVLDFYGSLMGEFPYPSFTLAVVESELPGGHSPAYFAQINEPPALLPLVWRGDPAYFQGFDDFFLAHELAHQWWGQAVGWKNFHEQWLSEGLAQYFAVLDVERRRPDDLGRILRQLRRWSMDESDQGPVYLGYRLGHIRGGSRVYRALVYNKSALVLHMLRRVVGDEAFFQGLRRYYTDWRFRKAGTEDFRAAFEAVTGRALDQFFEGWIYGQELPRVRYDWRTEGEAAVLTFEQLGDTTFTLPVTVSLELDGRRTTDRVVVIDYRTVEVRVPIAGRLRNVTVNDDHAALGEFSRQRGRR